MGEVDPGARATTARSLAPLLLGVAAVGAFAFHEALQLARAE